MSRLSAIMLVLAASATAHADDAAPTGDVVSEAPSDMHDQGIGAALGIAGGGRVTTGGARVTGHYLYQLTSSDWFDGTAAFTFGSGEPACFRDRMDAYLCDHGLVDGFSAEVAANVRRFFGEARRSSSPALWPYARLGVGVAIVRFADDDVTGLAIPVHIGGGIRYSVSEDVAVIGEAVFDIGFGRFNQGLGLEPQLGGSIHGGVEFGL